MSSLNVTECNEVGAAIKPSEEHHETSTLDPEPSVTSPVDLPIIRECVLQNDYEEHEKFLKHGHDLAEQASRSKKSTALQIEPPLEKPQEGYSCHEKHLLQLIYQHLVDRNLSKAASVLMRDTGLEPPTDKHASANLPSDGTCATTVVTQSRQSNSATPVTQASVSTPTSSIAATTPQTGPLEMALAERQSERPRQGSITDATLSSGVVFRSKIYKKISMLSSSDY